MHISYISYLPEHANDLFVLDKSNDIYHWSIENFKTSTHGIIAKNENTIVGFVIFTMFDTLDILRITVDKKYRNKGVATALITQLKSIHTPITLEVREDNILAIRLYSSLEFTEITTRKNYYFDGMNAKIMQFVKV